MQAASSGEQRREETGGRRRRRRTRRERPALLLSVAARCGSSNPLARITWPRGAERRLLSPGARGCCGREWWPVCAGALRLAPGRHPGVESAGGGHLVPSPPPRACVLLPCPPAHGYLCSAGCIVGNRTEKKGSLWTNMSRRGVSGPCLSFTSISFVPLLSSPLARACHPDKEMQVVSL